MNGSQSLKNMQHAYKTGLIRPKGIKVIDIATGKEFSSIKMASIFNNLNYQTLQRQLSGETKKSDTLCGIM
ncbi:MAG: hypothetical protein IPM91_08830 [Bacteroidetes bacterium]|nr:hypothetical protein [Bacteroidota bacterium]